MNNLDLIVCAYVECAEWSDHCELTRDEKRQARRDCKAFMTDAASLGDIPLEPEQIGRDVWLTRNGHGSGFWDRGLGSLGDELSDIARAMGPVVLTQRNYTVTVTDTFCGDLNYAWSHVYQVSATCELDAARKVSKQTGYRVRGMGEGIFYGVGACIAYDVQCEEV